MLTTPNYGLKKPEGTDVVNIDDFNGNADIIDTKLKDLNTTKAPLDSPVLTGSPAAPTAAANTKTTQLATTAFVLGQAGTAAPLVDGTAAVGTSYLYARQDHVHPTDTTRAPLASPTFTGTPAAPTAAVGTSTTQLATTAFVNNVLAAMGSNLVFSNSGTTMRGIQGTMGDNDQWRIGGCATASDAGYLELGTADNGNEPIYVRQYSGAFASIVRTLTLLDESGNTSIPGNLAVSGAISSVGSSAVVTNLNADLLDGVEGSQYYKHNGDTTSNVNLDTIETPGTYRINGSACTGLPPTLDAAAAQHSILSVVNLGGGLIEQRITVTNNTAYPGWTGNVFVRARSFSTAWSPWTRLATTSRYDLTLLNGWSMSYLQPRVSRSGAIATINLKIKGGTSSAGTNLCIIPQEYRPPSAIFVPVNDVNGNKIGGVGIYENGYVSFVPALSSTGVDAHITASWTVADAYYI